MIKISTKAILFFLALIVSNLAMALTPGTLVSNSAVCYNVDPGSTFNATAAGSGCSSITYQWLSSTDNVTFSNISAATAVNYNIPALTQTTYFKRKATDLCTSVETAVLTITVYAQPVAGTIATAATTVYCTSSVSLTSSVDGSGGPNSAAVTYQWQKAEFTGGAWGAYSDISGATSTSYTDNALTVNSRYRRNVTMASPCATQTVASNIITITYSTAVPTTPGTITSSTGTYNYCIGTTGITFTAGTVASAASYVWTLPAGVTATSATTSNVITVDFDLTYSGGLITCAGVNGCGTGSTRTRAVLSSSPLSAPGAISGGLAKCPDDVQNYSVTAVSGATSYTWTLPTGVTGTSTTRTISTTFDNTFTGGTISVYASNVCGDSPSSDATLTLNSLAAPANITGTLTQCPGNSGIVYTASTVSGAASYEWTVPTGVTIDAALNNQILVTFGPTFTGGSMTAAAVNGCGTGSTKSVTLVLNSVCDWTWTGATSTNWATASNWSTGSTPTSTSNVIIPNVTNKPTVSTATASCNNLTIESGASVTVGANRYLDIYGNLSNSGTLTTSTGTSAVRARKTSGAQTFSGDLSGIKYLIKLRNGALLLGNDWTVTGRIDLRAGTFNVNGYNLVFDVVNGGYIGFTTGDNGTISGNVTVTRPVSAKSHYISCPLDGVTASQISDDFELIAPSTGNSRLFAWDAPTQSWIRQTSGTSASLTRGQGFSFFCTVAGTLDFTGPYTPATTFNMNASVDAGEYLILGNPYLADLDWDLIDKVNVSSTVYYWNTSGNNFATYIAGGGGSANGGSDKIPVLQSFIVLSSTAGSAGVNLDRTMLNNTAPNTNFFREISQADKFKLKFSAPNATSDELIVNLLDGAVDEYEDDVDAYKFMNPSATVNAYTTLGSKDYVINTIGLPTDTKIVPVMFKAPVNGSYTISTSELSLTAVSASLKDKKTGAVYPINGIDITFDALTSDDAARFEIILSPSLTTSVSTSNNIAGISIGANEKTVFVNSSSIVIDQAQVNVMDATGRLVSTFTTSIQQGSNALKLDNVKSGFYVIQIKDITTDKVTSGRVTLQ